MITSKGEIVIPIIPSTSNEDTKGRYDQTPAQAQFFYALFATPGKQGYKVLDFGNYLSIWILIAATHIRSKANKPNGWKQL